MMESCSTRGHSCNHSKRVTQGGNKESVARIIESRKAGRLGIYQRKWAAQYGKTGKCSYLRMMGAQGGETGSLQRENGKV